MKRKKFHLGQYVYYTRVGFLYEDETTRELPKITPVRVRSTGPTMYSIELPNGISVIAGHSQLEKSKKAKAEFMLWSLTHG